MKEKERLLLFFERRKNSEKKKTAEFLGQFSSFDRFIYTTGSW
jgi:hypothetical protein